jgi:hypothetical protein
MCGLRANLKTQTPFLFDATCVLIEVEFYAFLTFLLSEVEFQAFLWSGLETDGNVFVIFILSLMHYQISKGTNMD